MSIKKSNCWWCVHAIKNVALCLPISYDRKHDQFDGIGFFCGWECMKAYNVYDNNSGKDFRSSLITMMFQKMNPNKINKINIAPLRQCLKLFGGTMSIEEFRSNDDTNFTFLPKLIVQNPPSIEKNINFKWIEKEEAIKNYNKQTKTVNTNQLKVKSKNSKTEKPHQTLDKSLGIFALA
jgi:hypothetical protein